MVGFLKITFGCMFSSKTQTLLAAVTNFITFNEIHKSQNPRVLIINSVKDNRKINKNGNLTTHNKYKEYTFPSCVENVSLENLNDLSEDFIKKFDYIAIDEAQFFSDLKSFVDKCLLLNKYIHCAGLIADSEKKPFGDLYLLIPYADEVTQLKAFCKECRYWYKNAVFTKWISSEKKESQTNIGAEGKYVPVCGKHY